VPGPVNMVDPVTGNTYSVPEEQVEVARARQWAVEGEDQAVRRISSDVKQETYGTPVGKIASFGAGVFRTASGGLLDHAAGALGGQQSIDELNAMRETNPISSVAGDVAGVLLPTGLGGAATRAGGAVAKLGEGAGVIGKIATKAAGGVVEGGLLGAGQVSSELALSADELTLERAGSIMSSNMLFGGAAAGVAKAAELGLSKARGILDKVAESHAAQSAVADDLIGLDAKGLRASKQAEIESAKTAHAAELEAIESARVPQRQQLADEITAFRREMKEQKHFLLTKDVELPEVAGKMGPKELGKVAVKANRTLDNLLDNPVGLAKNPGRALDALQRQENALAKLTERADELRGVFAKDASGARMAALDTVGPALERNRALQAKIAELSTAPASARLAQIADGSAKRLSRIADAQDALTMGGVPKSLGERMAGGAVYGGVAGAVGSVPLVGPMLAPFAGAAAAKVVGEKVFGRMGKAIGDSAVRTQKAVEAFVDVSGKVLQRTPVVATKVLGQVSYAPAKATKPPKERDAKPAKLPELYKARADEIMSQVAYGPDGKAVMRQASREAVAARLSPIRAVNPLMADRLETHAARKIEFLANKLERRPDLGVMRMGPDRWQPSDMGMRKWARYAAAVEDPGGIEERLAHGTVTPEDAEVMREVYPERMAAITRMIVEQVATLQKTLPYARRLALSIFSGVPVDAAMHPQVLAVLQDQFDDEPGTEGGIKPPEASPQFGSIKAEQGTPSQLRQGA